MHHDLEMKKIDLGVMDYYNLNDINNWKISNITLNRKNENQLFHSINFTAKKPGILKDINNHKKTTKTKKVDFLILIWIKICFKNKR